MIRYKSRFSHSSTIPATNASEYTAPEGLLGLFKMMALVYGPTASAISSTVGSKPPSRAVTGTGTPPAIFTISGKLTQYGTGKITSSLGSRMACSSTMIDCLAPPETMTFSGATRRL